jgi:lysozyme family protein
MSNSANSRANRRTVLVGALSSAVGIQLASFLQLARAQQAPSPAPSQELATLESRAAAAGLAGQGRGRALASASEDPNSYSELLPQLLDLVERTSTGRSLDESISDDAAELLSRIHQAEHGAPAEDLERKLPPSIESTRAQYKELFQKCSIKDKYKDKVAFQIDFLQRNKDKYSTVANLLQSSIPWYFIGIIHSLEASFNFKSHLHNGDVPLSRKTVHVPAGRPLDPWNPPYPWEGSANDALRMKNFDKENKWGLTSLLYRFEAYNGFGYFFRNKPSPYLWSFSNNYEKGKYVADGSYDANYVSQQCGAATMLKALIEIGAIPSPTDDV